MFVNTATGAVSLRAPSRWPGESDRFPRYHSIKVPESVASAVSQSLEHDDQVVFSGPYGVGKRVAVRDALPEASYLSVDSESTPRSIFDDAREAVSRGRDLVVDLEPSTGPEALTYLIREVIPTHQAPRPDGLHPKTVLIFDDPDYANVNTAHLAHLGAETRLTTPDAEARIP